MTRAKLPLPTLRFVVRDTHGTILFRLIPQTTPKGRVMHDLWCVPGNETTHTSVLAERCKRQGWKWRIEGEAPRQRLRALLTMGESLTHADIEGSV